MKNTTPFLIETNYNLFNDYYNTLTKKSRYNYNCVMKKYNNFTFKKLENKDGCKLKNIFETIWSKQLIRNKPISKPNIKISEKTLFFGSYNENNNIVCLHIIEEYENYCYSHMPMYDKNQYDELSKYSWFSLIRYVIENMDKIGLDMGGPCGRSKPHKCNGVCNPNFKFIVKNKEICDKYTYKFVYLTEEEKKNPKKYWINNNKLIILS